MSFWNKISVPFDKIVDSVGKAFDDNFTSDEERLEAKNIALKEINDAKIELGQLALLHEKEITARHANDMKSDSWLSKNVRPMVLLTTMGTIYALVYMTVFMTLTELQIGVLESWIPVLVGVFSVMVTFYFGGRSWEKATKIKQGKKND